MQNIDKEEDKKVLKIVKSPTDAAGNYSNISELLILKIKLRMFVH
jgi:hypothetical protein